MKWFLDLKIGMKLIIAFICIAIFAAAVGVVGIISIKAIEKSHEELYAHMTVPISELADISTHFQRSRVNMFEVLSTIDPLVANDNIDKLTQRHAVIAKDLESYNKTILTASMRGLYDDIVKKNAAYEQQIDKVVGLAKQGNNAEGIALMSATGSAGIASKELEDAIARIIEANLEDAKLKFDNNSKTANTSTLIMINIVLACALTAIAIIVDQIGRKNTGRKAEKRAMYLDKETAKLLANIENLALGKLQCNSEIEPTDEDTNSIGEMFSNIYRSLEESLKTMSSYVLETAQVLTEMSKGNLDLSITGYYKGDFVGIKNAVNLIIDSLNEVLCEMNNASGQVAVGSRQVSDSAQALAQGATEQASAIEELTASMEEISTQTKLNASNATQANELALSAKEGAARGNDQMKGMLKAMDDINEGSGNIFKIIRVIDEIAFQTNILALNAAVEAARAGQHGKGFAVVAEEVRNLAARSANAAKETTALIEGSIKKVEGGTKIANDTAVALSQIVEGVTKVTSLVGEIAAASNEQALGINQVNLGILQVSDVVQTNSATSEESAAASEELTSQAELLREQVSRFKLKKRMVSSNQGLEELSPDVLHMLEDKYQKRMEKSSSMNQGYAEAAAAATSSKPKISLSDQEFGKY